MVPEGGRTALLESTLTDLPSWWGEPGRVGWTPDVDLGSSFPWTLAGHVVGTWKVLDPERTPRLAPFPGVLAMQTPLSWFDSVGVASDRASSFDGFDGAMQRIAGATVPAPRRGTQGARAQGDFVVTNGSSAYDENALSLRRGDSLSWTRVEALGWKRGSVGALSDAGRHRYGLAGHWTRGGQRFEASFAQQGAAGGMAGGEGQSVTGAGGQLGYGFAQVSRLLLVRVGRGYDHHESAGPELAPSRRDAHGLHTEAILEGGTPASGWTARLAWQREFVVRATGGEAGATWRSDATWLSLSGVRPLAGGTLSAGLGGGHHGGVDRFAAAPSIGYRFESGPLEGRLVFERVLTPLWSDLAPGVAPFLQSIWWGGLDARLSRRGLTARASWRAGRTRDRALVARLPVEDLWLRSGFRSDPDPYDFGIVVVEGEWRGKHGALVGEVHQLFRDDMAPMASVDPRRGGRAYAEVVFQLFGGDLGVRVRGEAEELGGRVSDTTGWALRTRGAGTPAPRALERFVDTGAALGLSLADVVFTIRVHNLADTPRPEPWLDLRTGSEALGPGREFRVTLQWRLFN